MLYLNTNEAFNTFEQLPVKEILFNGPWRLYGPAALVIT